MSRLLVSLEYYMGEILDLLPVVVLAGILCVVIRWKQGNRLASARGMTVLLFTCYMAGLLALTAVPNNLWKHLWYVLRYRQPSGITFRLFAFEHQLIPDFWTHFGPEKLANLLLYVPFGCIVPLLRKREGGGAVLAMGFMLSIGVETLQLFVGRSLDANDIILNAAGTAVGYGVFLLLRALFPAVVARCWKREL